MNLIPELMEHLLQISDANHSQIGSTYCAKPAGYFPRPQNQSQPPGVSTPRSLSLLATQLTMRPTTYACPWKVVVPLGGASMYFVQTLPDHRPHWPRCLLASCHLFQTWLHECAPLFFGWLRYTVSDNPKCKLLYVPWLLLFFFSFFSSFILS